MLRRRFINHRPTSGTVVFWIAEMRRQNAQRHKAAGDHERWVWVWDALLLKIPQTPWAWHRYLCYQWKWSYSEKPFFIFFFLFVRSLLLSVFEQRDAAEYFEKILCRTSPEAAMVETHSLTRSLAHSLTRLLADSWLHLAVQMFKGELNHKATCLGCKERNDSRSKFWILPLAVEDSRRQTYSVVLCFPLTRISVLQYTRERSIPDENVFRVHRSEDWRLSSRVRKSVGTTRCTATAAAESRTQTLWVFTSLVCVKTFTRFHTRPQ